MARLFFSSLLCKPRFKRSYASMQDVTTQKCAFSIGNIMQSAQLNRELPPMHTYNFMPMSECDLKVFAPIVDDICAAGNLQSQLEDYLLEANERKRAYDEEQQRLAEQQLQQLQQQQQQQQQQQHFNQVQIVSQSAVDN